MFCSCLTVWVAGVPVLIDMVSPLIHDPRYQFLHRPDRASVSGCRWQMATPQNVSFALALCVCCQGPYRVEPLDLPLH